MFDFNFNGKIRKLSESTFEDSKGNVLCIYNTLGLPIIKFCDKGYEDDGIYPEDSPQEFLSILPKLESILKLLCPSKFTELKSILNIIEQDCKLELEH